MTYSQHKFSLRPRQLSDDELLKNVRHLHDSTLLQRRTKSDVLRIWEIIEDQIHALIANFRTEGWTEEYFDQYYSDVILGLFQQAEDEFDAAP